MRTNYDVFLESVKDIDSLSSLLGTLANGDVPPWTDWFDKKYCKNCPVVSCSDSVSKQILGIDSYYGGTVECAYCELEFKCRFFPELNRTPTETDVIKLWLAEDKND